MTQVITTLFLAFTASLGVHWVYTALSFGWSGFNFGPRTKITAITTRLNMSAWLTQAGLNNIEPKEFVTVMTALSLLSGLTGYAIFGSLIVSTVIACFAASFPVLAYKARRVNRRRKALQAWPQMIEEIRMLTSSLGRSIPQALFEVGEKTGEELQPAFRAAHREWLLTTDLASTLSVLKRMLADNTADVACETLLISHELGGNDLDKRLESLAEDRRQDMQNRKDAYSRQAGARFARIFVLVVPAGMALAGMSIGNGKEAYQTPLGQIVVLIALFMVIGCWWWAGQVMKIPASKRVFQQ